MSTHTVDPVTGEITDPVDADTDTDPDEDEAEQAAEDERNAEREDTQAAGAETKSQKEIEAMQTKLDAEAQRHDKRVREILGDEIAVFVPCPIDHTPGYVMHVAGMPMPDDVRAAIASLWGEEAFPDYLSDPTTETCATCGGWGETLSGGKGGNRALKVCSGCGGNGWMTKTTPVVLAPLPPQSYDANNVAVAGSVPALPPRPEPFFNPATQTWELPSPN